jgi:hypothetical protein
MVGDEGRPRRPRVTTRKKNDLEGNNPEGGRGLYSWQSGEGGRYLIRYGSSKLDGDEMSPLYKITVFTVGLVQMRQRQSPAEC